MDKACSDIVLRSQAYHTHGRYRLLPRTYGGLAGRARTNSSLSLNMRPYEYHKAAQSRYMGCRALPCEHHYSKLPSAHSSRGAHATRVRPVLSLSLAALSYAFSRSSISSSTDDF